MNMRSCRAVCNLPQASFSLTDVKPAFSLRLVDRRTIHHYALLALACSILLSAATPSHAATPIRVMLLDGDSASAHPWPPITAVLKEELNEAGIFQTDIVTAPKADGDFTNFKPDFSKYQVIVLNYDAQDWPESLKTPFEAFVKNGGGLVTVHAAETAFPNWKEFNEMIGMSGFRGRTEKDGPLWFMKDGKLVVG